ncbi:MAG: winged helix-turn-helix domain-containing protein [Xanthomonadales bacterium]|nr:winged helix-turn-helix domain-containing protein [Xanthomonadales bacterium]
MQLIDVASFAVQSADADLPDSLVFGEFELRPGSRELLRDGTPVALERRAFDVLLHLLRHRDRVVSKDELWQALWHSRDVSETVIPQAVGKVRRALNDADGHWITTVHGVGYRFVGALEQPARPASGQRRLRVALGFAALLLLVVSAIWLGGRSPPASPADEATIAVLPFVNLGPDPDSDYFADGIAETLLNQLADIDGLQVASRTSSFRFRSAAGEATPALAEIAQALQVRYLIEGSVRREAERFQVSVQLTDATTGYQRWSQRYDGRWGEILTTQQAITRSVVEQIASPLLSGAIASADPAGTATDPVAYELYLRGRHLWNERHPQALAEAMVLFERAAALQPDFALAYTGQAECILTAATYAGLAPEAAQQRAKALLDQALALAPDAPETRMALGNYYAARTQWPEAEAELLAAVALRPSSDAAHMLLGTVYSERGDLVAAYSRLRTAQQLNPLHATVALNLAQAASRLGLHERARRYLDRVQQLAPAHPFVFGLRTVVELSAGNTEGLQALLQQWQGQARELAEAAGTDDINRRIACGMASLTLQQPEQTRRCLLPLLDHPAWQELGPHYQMLALTHLASAKATDADPGQATQWRTMAIEIGETALQAQPGSEILLYELAIARLGLGDIDEARTLIDQSLREGRMELGLMQHDVRLSDLRPDPAFVQSLQRLEQVQRSQRERVLQRYPDAAWR